MENAELKLSYEEAYELVLKGLSPLGEEYNALLRRGRDERWIDVCETDGKRSGAYSIGIFGNHPFVLLNYQKTTHDVFTIAHEMGHSIHSYFSNANQPFVKSDYKIFGSRQHGQRGPASQIPAQNDGGQEPQKVSAQLLYGYDPHDSLPPDAVRGI